MKNAAIAYLFAYLLNLSLLVNLAIVKIAKAQVIPDKTLPENSVVNSEGNKLKIDGGTTRGDNLFHSFQEFSVPENITASFNNSTAIQHIFSRVTGNSISNIEGILEAQGNANLFLINPNGIIFGKDASLNIGGSFLATTADGIRFADGTEFNTTPSNNIPLLTVSAPVGLGLDINSGKIINYSEKDNVGLQVDKGETISFTGGEVSFIGGKVSAPSGKVEILGEKISLIDNAGIDVSSDTGGGTVLIGKDANNLINATRVYIDETVTINADGLIAGNGGRVIRLVAK